MEAFSGGFASARANSAGSSNFPVVFGSANSSSSRPFKKPTMPSNVPGWFTENDKDGDGQLSMNEWPKDKFEEFQKYDRNGDGIITLEEAMRTVPKAEVAAAPAPASSSSTTTTTASTTAPAGNTSSTTSAASASSTTPAAASASTPQPAVFTMRMGGPTGGSGAPATPMNDDEARRRVDQVFMFIDSNKDGILDEKEIDNSRTIKSIDWKKYDANRDGKLDKNEAIALYKAEGSNMRGGWGGGAGGGGGPWGGQNP
ncbi:MAG TPA: hypothetical protein PKA06_13840, partial [Gemmatales bacterium]|nr:hypothetical protein [Gemmatales bacterium]